MPERTVTSPAPRCRRRQTATARPAVLAAAALAAATSAAPAQAAEMRSFSCSPEQLGLISHTAPVTFQMSQRHMHGKSFTASTNGNVSVTSTVPIEIVCTMLVDRSHDRGDGRVAPINGQYGFGLKCVADAGSGRHGEDYRHMTVTAPPQGGPFSSPTALAKFEQTACIVANRALSSAGAFY